MSGQISVRAEMMLLSLIGRLIYVEADPKTYVYYEHFAPLSLMERYKEHFHYFLRNIKRSPL